MRDLSQTSLSFLTRRSALAGIPLLLGACRSEPDREEPIGEAYVGPYELELISDLSPEAPSVATLHHGEQVAILEYRRRFARVRSKEGVEGWTDGLLLLSTGSMARLRRLSMNATALTPQGKATVYDTLNVHTDPNRDAPSFHQLQEGNLTEVVAHQLVPRRPYEPAEGQEILTPINSYEPPFDAPPPGPLDDWSLVRLRDGRAGWILTRMVVMAIPDEVAQYAEGDRIASYHSLGSVIDQGQIKHHWLWTTRSRPNQPYQFDSFRVFIWSKRRHRYETSYIERNLVGYYPVVVHRTEDPAVVETQEMPQFTLILRDADGAYFKRTYAFETYRVRLVSKVPWSPPQRRTEVDESEYVEMPPPGHPSLFRQLVDRLKNLFA